MAQQKVDGPQEPLRRTQAPQRYKVAAVYAVTAWLLIQTAVVLDTSTGLMTAIIVLLALGFAMAIYISWTFEATPEGMKRTENVPPDAVLPTWSHRKFAALIIIIAALAVSLLVFDLLRTKPASPPETSPPDLTGNQ